MQYESPATDVSEAMALYETTQEICSRLDLDQVLTAIVGRARQLLDAEFGYLAMADESTRQLRMRAVDNVRSERFRTAVLPYGVGLGGTVASERAPISTADYLVDASMSHSDDIDSLVVEEGMVAALATPVLFRGQLLAVLFVGRREPRGFTPHQTTLLSSLANSAAIAISNAQTHGRLAQAMTLHNDLVAPALAGHGTRAVIARLGEVIGARVTCLDWQGHVMASSGPALPVPGTVVLRDVSRRSSQTHTLVLSDGVACRARAIVLGTDVEGFVLVEAPPSEQDVATLGCEQAATVVALELARVRTAEQLETAYHGEVLDALTGPGPLDVELVRRRTRRLGFDVDRPHVLALVRPATGDDESLPRSRWKRVEALVTATARDRFADALVAVRPDSISVAVAADEDAEVVAAFAELTATCTRLGVADVVVGVSRPCSEVGRYAAAAAEAELACRRAANWPGPGRAVGFAALGFHQLVLGARPVDPVVEAARRSVEPLLASGGPLYETLTQWLASCCNAEGTARALGVHPNTLRSRLERIAALLDVDLNDALVRLDLHLAVTALARTSG